MGPEDFQQDVTTRDYTVYDYNAAQRGAFDTNSWNGYYFWAVPAETGRSDGGCHPHADQHHHGLCGHDG